MAAAEACLMGHRITPATTQSPRREEPAARSDVDLGRRGFIGASVTGCAAGLATGAGALLLRPRPARAQTIASPDAALQEMMAGNRRYVEGAMTSFNEDLAILKEKTVEKQEPFAAVLSCADSRVPVEIIFDQSIGHVFVARVAGNGTKAIMVLGHSNCGAVKATIDAKAVPGQISALYPYIRPAVDQAGPNLDAAIKANAKIQAGLLRQASPVIAEAVKANKLKVVAAQYDLASGKVSLLD